MSPSSESATPIPLLLPVPCCAKEVHDSATSHAEITLMVTAAGHSDTLLLL
jgi:hypothetical protein